MNWSESNFFAFLQFLLLKLSIDYLDEDTREVNQLKRSEQKLLSDLRYNEEKARLYNETAKEIKKSLADVQEFDAKVLIFDQKYKKIWLRQKFDVIIRVFPLFIRFPYLKTFDEIPPKSLKPRTEIGFSDHSRQIWTIFCSFRGLVLNFWTKSFKFHSKWATKSLILPKNGLFSKGFLSNKGNFDANNVKNLLLRLLPL